VLRRKKGGKCSAGKRGSAPEKGEVRYPRASPLEKGVRGQDGMKLSRALPQKQKNPPERREALAFGG